MFQAEQKVIFWDFDGTISHSNKMFSTALYNAVKEMGYEINCRAAMEFLENAYPWKTPFSDHSDEVGEKWWNAFYERIKVFCRTAGIREEDLDQINAGFKAWLSDSNNYCLYEDTIYVLEASKQKGYRNYLLTNNYPEIVDNLKKLGIAEYFTDFIVSSHVGYDKPRKELYEYAIKLANYSKIGYMVGDNPVADMWGAKRAGLKTIFVHNGQMDGADYCVDHLKEILSILE